MILKAKIIYDIDDDGKERTIEITSQQLCFILEYCRDLNALFKYLDSLSVTGG